MIRLLMEGLRIGFCFTGSFCTLSSVVPQVEKFVKEGASVIPVFSNSVATTDTRFTKASDFRVKIEDITGNKVIDTIVDAEPIGPKGLLDLVIIAPCTGNTLSKLCHGITDTPVLMAAKAHLRNLKPVLIALATNDGLGNNAKNIGQLINTKNIFLVPFEQDDPEKKKNSLVADMDMVYDAAVLALQGKQIQPILIKG